MECNFCKSILKTNSSLNYHMKNNKKCLEIQSKTSDDINSALVECEYCNKIFTNIKKHLNVCKERKKESIEQIKNDYIVLNNQYNILKNEKDQLIINYDKKIQELKDYIIKLETENSIYKKDHETISDIAKQPKTTNNNIINNLCVYDDNEIKNRFSVAISNIKPSDLYDGQKSIGRFVAPCLKNDDGTKMLSCTDYSRNVFVYKDKNGNINKDIKCKNLADLIEPIATAKADELLKEDYINKEKSYKLSELHDKVNARHDEIKELRNHLLGFQKDTKKWKYLSDLIEKKVQENEVDMNEIENLENEGINTDDEDDTKLITGVDDIKEMKKDSTKFSKVLSELV